MPPAPPSPPPLLCLLDGAALVRGGQRAELAPSAPTALLACLALHGDWVARERVTALFWPDAAEADAQHHLRVTLHRARRWLAAQGAADALAADRRRLRLALPCDVAAFRRAVDAGDWAQAVALHRAPLWPSFSVRGFDALHAWLAQQRDALVEAWRAAALQLAAEREAAGDASGAATLLQAQLQHDLMAEDVVQALMRVAARAGQRAAALDLFERYRRRARDELGLEPLPGTLALAAQLRQADPPATPPRPALAAAQGPALPALGRLSAPPLAGRQAEQAALQPPRPGLWLLQGEPGVGKTRLAAEAWPGARWLRCTEGGADAPLQPLVEALAGSDAATLHALLPDAADRRLLARLRPDLAAGERLPPQDAPGDRLPALLAQWLLAWTAGSALVVDDLQWADGATLQVLQQVLAGGAAVAATLRSGSPPPRLEAWLDDAAAAGWLHRLPLAPLSAAGVDELLQRLDIPTPQAGFAAALHAHTGGNPFFLIETLRAGQQRGSLPPLAGVGESAAPAAALPERVAAVVQRRVAALDESTQRVLTLAALAGDAEQLDGLAELAGLSPWATAQALATAQDAGLLVGRRFVHDLVRQALRARTPEPLRVLLHAGIVRRLSGVLPPHRVAEHAWAAGDTPAAVSATLQAAALDRERGLHAQAAERLAHALQRVGDGPEAARLHGALAITARECGDPDTATAHAHQALLQLPLPETRAAVAAELFEIVMLQGRLDDAERWLDAAAESGADEALVAMGRCKIAHARGDLPAAEAQMRQRLALLRRRAPGAELAATLTSLATVLDSAGRLAEAEPLHLEALRVARRIGARYVEVEVAINRLWSLDEQDRLDEAVAVGEQALALGEYDATPYVASTLAYVYLRQGRLDDAERLYRRLAAGPDGSMLCVARAKLADIAARRGNADVLQAAVEAALQAIDRTEIYSAQAIAITSVLRHGSDAQAAAARTRLRAQPLDPGLQQRLDEALAQRATAAAAPRPTHADEGVAGGGAGAE